MKFGRCGECNCCEFDPSHEAPKTCECGHKRCFHLPPSTAQNSVPPSPSNNNKSISEIVGPVFVKEVNQHLQHNLPSCLPVCRMSDIRSRQIESEDGTCSLLEIDSYGYIFEDDLMYGEELKTSGIYLVTPKNCGQWKPTKATQKISHSPGVQERKLEKMAEKYIIGASYSGQSVDVVTKVHTLEAQIRKMIDRYKEKHNGLADDITCSIGAVLLCFSSGTKERIHAHTNFSDILYREMSSNTTPSLWRLAQARRFYLLVLSGSENPNATSLREIVGMNESMQTSIEFMVSRDESRQKSIESMVSRLTSLDETMKTMTHGFKALGVLGTDPVKDSASSRAARKQQKKRRSTNSSPADTPCKYGDSCRNLLKGNCRYFHPPEHQKDAAAKEEKE